MLHVLRSMTHDLITIGDSLMDVFFVLDKNANCVVDKKKKKLCFDYAEKICIEDSTHAVGGNAANVAVGARMLGLNTAILTDVGDDLNGHLVKEAMEKRNIDTSLIRLNKGQETRYSVVLSYEAERTILSYHAKRTYRFPKSLSKTQWIYYTSLGAGFETLQSGLLGYLKKNPEVRLAVNPGSFQMTHGLSAIRKILPHAAVLFVNKEEAIHLAGKKNGNIDMLFRMLHKAGIGTVFITDSEQGSYASDGIARWYMPPYPIRPIAKTGAGDAYTSGALGALILGKGTREAMQWGTANAGGVIQQFGAQEGLLDIQSIQMMIRKFKKIEPKNY